MAMKDEGDALPDSRKDPRTTRRKKPREASRSIADVVSKNRAAGSEKRAGLEEEG